MAGMNPRVSEIPTENRGVDGAESGAATIADRLLASIGSIRRNARKQAGRPPVLSTLTDAELELVRLVSRTPGKTVNEAATALHVAPNTVSTLVGKLAASDVLVRAVDPSDRRVVRLQLRPGIRRSVEAFRDRRHSMLAEAIAGLSERQRRDLLAALPVLETVAGLLADREARQPTERVAP